MPRNIDSNFSTYQPSISLAALILIERVDGVVMGFTSWDVSITFNVHDFFSGMLDSDIEYLPAVSLSPSGIKSNADLTTDQMDILGAIDSVYITDEDIRAGRYDSADITIMRVNPNHLNWGPIIDLVGNTGQATYGDGQFQIDISSLGKRLSQQIGEIVSPSCPVILGDPVTCKVDMTSFRFSRTVATVTSQRELIFADTHATGYYDFGMVRFASSPTGGANYSLNREIKTHVKSGSNAIITLQEKLPYTVNTGDAVILEAGCDRKALTCRSKFNNLVNFHGFPYVPGNDYLLQKGRPPS